MVNFYSITYNYAPYTKLLSKPILTIVFIGTGLVSDLKVCKKS